MTLALGSGGLSVGKVGRGQAIADNPTAISGRPAVERMVSVGPGQRRGRVLPPLLWPRYRCRNVNVFVSLRLPLHRRLRVCLALFSVLSPTHHGVAREQIRQADTTRAQLNGLING